MLGASFPRQAIEAVSDIDPAMLDELLSSLVRKEVLTVRADKLSPERGQYAFTQSLIRSVAYDMLTRAERKARHLRTAEHLRSAFPDEGAEVAEVIAAHLLRRLPGRQRRPRRRRASCPGDATPTCRPPSGPSPSAPPRRPSAAYLKAAELSSDEAEQAGFTEKGGPDGRPRGLERTGRSATSRRRSPPMPRPGGSSTPRGSPPGSARRSTPSAGASWRSPGSARRSRHSRGRLAPPEVVADLQARLGALLVFSGHADEAAGPIEEALTLAQHHELAEPLASALNSKASSLSCAGRAEEARALYELARRRRPAQRDHPRGDDGRRATSPTSA